MCALPSKALLASYWIPAVGIGDPLQWVTVPITEYAKYRLPNGAPQTNVVFLFNATFTGTPQNFKPPYISIPEDLLKQVTLQPGQRQTNVQYLQSLESRCCFQFWAITTTVVREWDGTEYPPARMQNLRNG
jgi:hypothetical protein